MKKLVSMFALVSALAAAPAQQAIGKEGEDCCAGKGKSTKCEEVKTPAKAGKEAGRSCKDCAKVCEKTLAYFKKKGGKYTEAANLQKLEDCITLCKASADLQDRKSPHAKKLLEVCHQVCLDCAQMCEDMKDPNIADCVTSCRECSSCCEG